MLKKVEVQAALAKAQADLAAKADVSQTWVVSELRRTYGVASGTEPKPATFDGPVATRSLELIGKHLGMFADRVRLEVDDARPLARYTLDELEAMLASGRLVEGTARELPAGAPQEDASAPDA